MERGAMRERGGGAEMKVKPFFTVRKIGFVTAQCSLSPDIWLVSDDSLVIGPLCSQFRIPDSAVGGPMVLTFL